MHDNINQVLGAAKLYIEMAKTYEEKSEIYLNKAAGYIVHVIKEIRKISKRMLPVGIDGMGLSESIKNLIADLMVMNFYGHYS